MQSPGNNIQFNQSAVSKPPGGEQRKYMNLMLQKQKQKNVIKPEQLKPEKLKPEQLRPEQLMQAFKKSRKNSDHQQKM